MKIKREINGEQYDIELTEEELYNAYREQEFLFDKQDVLNMIDGLSDDEIHDILYVDRATFEKYTEDMACEMRRNIDKYDMSWDAARDEAARYVLRNFSEGAK